MRLWHDAHPGHRPVILKLELKDGFAADLGRGPADLDALLAGKLGDALYRPGRLAAGHPDLDTAARAVAPAIDSTRPTQAQARDRLALLAGHHASVVSADWYPLPQVLATVVPRG
ncbi:hypothetical protein [Streptomyces subrutilus]|uniref:Uncharacterized protein n=1 Tax=Streptomyces subrutilus TaxID=36818 RepID=A0A1E5PXX5_9ACTN|nr:hypothetical protein BGK67_26105 [Streptomyces subrutilus]